WVVATRPVSVNGLGKTAAEAAADLASLKTLFTLLDDTPAVFPTWELLVTGLPVIGKDAHDARLVAAMQVQGIDQILTFNDRDFHRFSGITAVNPSSLVTPPATP